MSERGESVEDPRSRVRAAIRRPCEEHQHHSTGGPEQWSASGLDAGPARELGQLGRGGTDVYDAATIRAGSAAEVGSWTSQFPRRKWVNLTNAKKPDGTFKSVSKLCSHFLRHDKTISHGNDEGVAVSVLLTEMRVGAGGDSGRPHVRDGEELIHGVRAGHSRFLRPAR